MHFQILGPLRVTDGDEREIALGGAKPAAVLAMLLLHPNEVVSADRLIEDLWEGEPPPTAAKTVQVHMSRLRRALGGAHNGDTNETIQTTGGGYLLQVEPEQVDALYFARLVAEGTAALSEGAHARASARMRSALALWRGTALADFTYSSFAQDEIARLDGLRLVALESAVEAELALGRHAELIPELRFLVKRHPVSEHLRAQLMLALYRSGRQAEALGIYRAGRRVLVDQLGIEPGEELREMERAILAQDASLSTPAARGESKRDSRERSTRGAFVGYEGELAALEQLLEDALQGHGRLALLAGEPGVGKTRLADELTSVARARGARVAWGRCRSGGGAPAYWPWIQVLRALIADRDPVALRAALGSPAADLSQLLPELRDLLPDLAAPGWSDSEEARFRLFDGAATFLTRVASGEPIVIVLDDLHAADQSTLAMLEHVAPALLDAPVLIVGTHRDTDADLEQPLRDSLTQLARATDCLQLVLTGLSEEGTAHFVEVSAGVAPMPLLAAALHETSSGNPLFVSELVRLLRAEDRLHELADDDELVLPRGVDQVIARRVERLSDACRRTLSLAAVVGREFEVTLLERAGDSAGEELLGELDDAIAARVVELAPGGGFRFSHDLVRSTLYSALGGAEQRRMHEAVGRVLAELHAARPEPVAAALAHHFAAALPGGDAAEAVQYLTLAGDVAAELPASHEAASYYKRAAELARDNALGGRTVLELYVRLAEQLVAIPDPHRAQTAVEDADALLAAAGDRALEARLTIARTHLHLLDALALDEDSVFEAIEMFQELGDPASEARAWYALVTINCGHSDRLKGGEAAERMLDCARRAGSKSLIGSAMRSIGGNFALGAGTVPVAIPRVRALLAEAPDAMTRARLTNSLGRLEAIRGRFDEARARFAEAFELCPPGDRSDFKGYQCSTAAQSEFHAGNLGRAAELARESCASLEAQGLVRYLSSEMCFLVDPLIGLGELEEAEALLERAKPYAASDDVDALMRQARSRARLEIARGTVDAAEPFAREAVAYVAGADAPDEHAECLLLLADIRGRAGDDDEVRALAAEALAISERRGNAVFEQQARAVLGEPVAMS